MYFGTFNPQVSLQLDNFGYRQLSGIYDLEVKYSKGPSLTVQASSRVSRARRLIGLINNYFHVKESKITFYGVYVRPLLDYCPIISSCMRSIDRRKIIKVQCHFKRLLAPDLSYKYRCEAWKLEPLSLRRINATL